MRKLTLRWCYYNHALWQVAKIDGREYVQGGKTTGGKLSGVEKWREGICPGWKNDWREYVLSVKNDGREYVRERILCPDTCDYVCPSIRYIILILVNGLWICRNGRFGVMSIMETTREGLAVERSINITLKATITTIACQLYNILLKFLLTFINTYTWYIEQINDIKSQKYENARSKWCTVRHALSSTVFISNNVD